MRLDSRLHVQEVHEPGGPCSRRRKDDELDVWHWASSESQQALTTIWYARDPDDPESAWR
jgi:hypothetical protein